MPDKTDEIKQEVSQLDRIEKNLDYCVAFIAHARKVAEVMAKHPMLAGMLPPDLRAGFKRDDS